MATYARLNIAQFADRAEMDAKIAFALFVVILGIIATIRAIAWLIAGGWRREKPFNPQAFINSLTRDDRISAQSHRRQFNSTS